VLEVGSGTKFLTNSTNPTFWTVFGSHKELGGASLGLDLGHVATRLGLDLRHLKLGLNLSHMASTKNTIFFLGLIKVEHFLLAHPKMKLHFNLYIVFLRHFFL
jgi:hypothetical protein